MQNKTRISTTLLALFLPALLAAGPALAGEKPLRIGQGILNLGITVSEEYTDNLFLSSGDVAIDPDILYSTPTAEESEWITTVRPEIQFGLPMDNFILEAHGLAEWLRHRDFDDENTTNWEAGGSLGAEFPGGLSFKLGDNYTGGMLPATQEFGVSEDYSVNEINAFLGFRFGDRMRLEGNYYNYNYNYDLSADRERTENVFGATAYWKFQPRTSALVEYSYGNFDYDANPEADNTSHQVRVGLKYEATGRSDLDARFGYQWRNYDIDTDPVTGEDRGNSSWVAKLDWLYQVSGLTRTTLGLRREFVESGFFGNPYYNITGVGGNIKHDFTRKLSAKAYADLSRDDYPNDVPRGDALESREDDLYTVGLTLGFDIFDWLTLELNGEKNHRDSTLDEFDYDESRVMFLVQVGYGSVKDRLRRTE